VQRAPAISGEALYWLAASPEAGRTSGRFFHLTIEEKPTNQALDRRLGAKVWERSLALTGLSEATWPNP